MRSFWRLSFQKFVSSVGWKCVLLREKAKSSHHDCVVRPKHWPTMNQKISVERQCLYLSFGNLFFQICPSKTLQWPLENQVPLGAMAKKEWLSISFILLILISENPFELTELGWPEAQLSILKSDPSAQVKSLSCKLGQLAPIQTPLNSWYPVSLNIREATRAFSLSLCMLANR